MNNPFLGVWKLQPEKSEYAQGVPPKEATYSFKSGEEKSLDVSISWKDAEGKSFSVSYSITPDGIRKKYENPQIADEVMSEFESENVLNTSTYKGGQLIAFATRIIGEDGEMKVIQRFFTPDGGSFENVQYYRIK